MLEDQQYIEAERAGSGITSMRSFAVFAFAHLLVKLPFSMAQDGVSTEVLYVVAGPSSTLSPISTMTYVIEGTPSALATSTTNTSGPATSVLQATSSQAASSSTSSSDSSYGQEYTAPDPDSVDTDGGASGSDNGSFSLSKGALAAIIAVVVIVAVFGGE